MMPNSPNASSYPTWVGFIFIFNLIVGTGALTLPKIFAKAGWLLSSSVLILLAVISFVTVTFVVEAMACANAVRTWLDLQNISRSQTYDEESDDQEVDVTDALLPRVAPIAAGTSRASEENSTITSRSYTSERISNLYYTFNVKFELGEIATVFFNDIGRILFYICIVIYLYGDLSIYSAAVAKSLRDVSCDVRNNSISGRLSIYRLMDEYDLTTPCWKSHTLTRLDVYRLFLIGFIFIFGPLSAFSVQKTKYLQILTSICRWLAFGFMISIAVKMLFSKGVRGHPATVNLYDLPPLIGTCVYSFMCHHSLPSLLAPLRNKLSFQTIISYDYIIICAFYLILAMTGIFAFTHLEDLYTLNFIPMKTSDHSFQAQLLLIIEYFLALFPVFTLSASFPIIAITLRNNLQTLFLDVTRFESYNLFIRRILFPLCAIIPPFIVTYFTENLTSLVAFTGSYAGAGIQYIIPVCLVYFARRTCNSLLGNGIINDFKSPFQSIYWLIFVLIWAFFCICVITVNLFYAA